MKGFLIFLAMGAAIGLSLWRGWWSVPPAWNPWAPLDIAQAPNFLTSFKLGRLGDDPALCEQVLATSSLRYQPLADSPGTAQCPLHNTVRVQGSQLRLSSSFVASCPLAVAFAMFERHALQPAAQAVFAEEVTQVDHLGSFACRNIYNRQNARRSQHASANALDIAGFRLADGRRINVLNDWPKNDDASRFLHLVRDGACKSFKTVLGPDYNAAHHNHLHLDMGPWTVCR